MIYAGGAAAASNGKGAGYVGYFASSISATGAAGNTAINFIQRIESANCSDMAAGKTYTFSGYVRATDTRTVTYQISSANTADTFTSTTVVSSGTLATTSGSNFIKFSVSFTATDACANGVEVAIVYGAVGAGVVVNASNIQLELGSIATPFEQRPIGLELSLCQRYYFRQTAGSANNERLGTGGVVYNSTTAQGYFPYPVPMRAVPSSSSGVGNGTNLVVWNGANYTVTSTAADVVGLYGANWSFSVASGLVAGQACQITRNVGATPAPYFEASAEL